MIASLAGVPMVASSLLAQPVGLAEGGVQVDGQRTVAGSGPCGPRPGQQLPAHPVQLPRVAPPETPQEGPQSLPSRKRGVDGALTTHPSTRAVPPARSAAASSMQSPPAAPNQGQPCRQRCRPDGVAHQFTQAQVVGQGDTAHQAVITRGCRGAQVVAFWVRGSVFQKPLSEHGSTSLPLQRTLIFSVDWGLGIVLTTVRSG